MTAGRNTCVALYCLLRLSALSCFVIPAQANNYIDKQNEIPTTVPDTGQNLCYDTVKVIPCPNSGEPFYGQDANYSINTPQYTTRNQGDTATVTDKITGLTWKRAPDTQPKTWSEAIDYVNQLDLSGFQDWRLPTKQELQTIFSYGPQPGQLEYPAPQAPSPDINKERSCAWTISNLKFPSLEAKTVCLPDKQGATSSKYKKQYVYAVRGPSYRTGQFRKNSNQTVTDQFTGLMWQSTETLGQKWEDALAYCEGLQLDGFDDWRLPTLKELMTLVNEERIGPSIDTSFFPATRAAAYWTSTTFSGHPGFAWYIRFDNGLEYNGGYKGRRYFVRAVRGGTLASTTQKTEPKPPAVSVKQHEVVVPIKPTPVPPEPPVKTKEPTKKTQPDKEEMDIFEPYPLEYELYEE